MQLFSVNKLFVLCLERFQMQIYKENVYLLTQCKVHAAILDSLERYYATLICLHKSGAMLIIFQKISLN